MATKVRSTGSSSSGSSRLSLAIVECFSFFVGLGSWGRCGPA